MEEKTQSIKSQLIERFKRARIVVGRDWRNQLAAHDPYFNTKAGVDDMNITSQASTEPSRRGQVDRLKRVVLAMETVAGIPHLPIL